MSRRYCKMCGVAHNNGGWGYCDPCQESVAAKEAAEKSVEDEKFAEFMALPEEDRWAKVFNFMQRIVAS